MTALEHLAPSLRACGSVIYWEKRGPRHWHPGPRSHTPADLVRQKAADLAAYRDTHPRYPPSHQYPPKPPAPGGSSQHAGTP
ncbi:hypothetical protein [Streptomyces sp. NPDC003857]